MKNEKINIKVIYVLVAFALLVLSIVNPFLNIPYQQKVALGIVLFCITLWFSEIAPLGIVGLLGVAISILLGINDIKSAFVGFSNPVIFLIIGSFLIALAFNKYNVDKRIALTVLSKKFFLKNPFNLIFGSTLITFLLSMWLSNTATTAMMVAIVIGIIYLLKDEKNKGYKKFADIFLLSIAYSASIGGIMTIVGSPTNLVGLGFLKQESNNIDFLTWMYKVSPIGISMYLFLLLYIKFYIKGFKLPFEETYNIILEEKKQLKSISKEEKIVVLVFLLTIFLWILPSILDVLNFEKLSKTLNKIIPESSVVILTVSLLFLIPTDNKNYKTVLNVEDLKSIDWDTILLFASGISLGSLIKKTGLGDTIASLFSNTFSIEYISISLFILIIAIIFLTEITSNTATVITFIPIIISILKSNNLDITNPVLSCIVAASFAFMLPIATPPNAIVYGTKFVNIKTMIKLGFILNIVGSVIIYTFLIE